MQAWRVEQHGGLEALKLVTLPVPEKKPGFHLIKVKALGVNHLDLWVRKGVPGHKFPLPMIPGCDVAGEIVGSNERVLVDPMLGVGDQFGLMGETADGGACEYVSVPIDRCLKLAPSVSFEEAAALPVPYTTAWQMLVKKGALKNGDFVLVHAPGSGVSVAALQICQRFGATVVAVTTTAGKSEKALKIGAAKVIVRDENGFLKQTKDFLKASGRRGFDLVLDHVGGKDFKQSLAVLKRGGKLLTCGATAGAEVSIDLKHVFFKELSILGSTMGEREDLKEVLSLVEKKELKPLIDSVLDFKDYPKAHSKLESKSAFGKIIIRFP